MFPFFFFNDTATTEIYTLSLHDALPISLPGCQALAVPPYLHLEFLPVVRPAFSRQTVFGRRPAASLQKFLQCRLMIRFRQPFAAFFERIFEKRAPQEAARRVQSAVKIDCSDDRLVRIRQQRPLL